MSPDTKRLDALLVEKGLCASRERAKEQILAGRVRVDGMMVRKPAAPVSPDAALTCGDGDCPYVGRGGLKLEKALTAVPIPLEGRTALDMGASTGGFTHCLLRRGAAKVYAVDVGHGQLHPTLQADERVVNLEGTDGRDTAALLRSIPKNSVHFASVDVSFISIKAILPGLLPFLQPEALLALLIKPQFEAGRAAVGKHGVVKDPKAHRRVLRELCAFFPTCGCRLIWLGYSPITGGSASGTAKTGGNIEYLAVLQMCSDADAGPQAGPSIDALVEEAFRCLKGSDRG